MLRFRDAIILFADKRLYNAYKDKVESARPVHTAMKAINLQMPLGDVLTKDGKQTYVQIKEGGITELIQVDDRLLTLDNLNKTQQLIKAESNWQTSGKNNEFVTRMLEGNDQMSMNAPDSGWNKLSNNPGFLFNEKELRDGNLVQAFLKEYGNLETYITYQVNKVAGGLVSAGVVYGLYFNFRWSAYVPRWLSFRPGVFVYSAAEGAKVDAATQPEQKEQPKIIIATTQELKDLVANAKAEVANAAAVLKDGVLGATQKLMAEIEKQLGQ
jgi:hypothetical protein